MSRNGALFSRGEGANIRLRDYEGKLIIRPISAVLKARVCGRFEWIGRFELINSPADEVAAFIAVWVMKLFDAVILGLKKIGCRIGYPRFRKEMLAHVGVQSFDRSIALKANGYLGIGVVIHQCMGHEAARQNGHVYDRYTEKFTFNRDCQEIEIVTPEDEQLPIQDRIMATIAGDGAGHKAERLEESKNSSRNQIVFVPSFLPEQRRVPTGQYERRRIGSDENGARYLLASVNSNKEEKASESA